MFAILGDLSKPSEKLQKPEWFEFDAAIMSMALHHIADPASMLTQLRSRLKDGGSLILIEWLGAKPHSHSHDENSHSEPQQLDASDMLDSPSGEKIWPGFTPQYFENALTNAGFNDVDVRVPGLTFNVPKEFTKTGQDMENKLVFVKAVAV